MAENGAICPNCGKQVSIPDDMEKCFCPYCATVVLRVATEELGEETAETPIDVAGEVEAVGEEIASAETPSEGADESALDTSDGFAAESTAGAEDSEPSGEIRVTEGQGGVVPPTSLTESADAGLDSVRAEPKKKSKKGLVIGLVSAAAVVVIALAIVFTTVIPGNKYAEATAAYEAGEYQTAMQKFVELGDYSGAKSGVYSCALMLISQGEYDYVLSELSQVDDAEVANYCSYTSGMKAMSEKKYDDAAEEFNKAPNFPYAQFALGVVKMTEKKYSDAISIFATTAALEPNNEEIARSCMFMTANCYFAQGEMNTAKELYEKLPLTYSLGSDMVYERLAAIALLGNSDKGTWRVYKWYGTDSDGNEGITKKGSELKSWGHPLSDGSFFALSKMRFVFSVKQVYACTDPNWVGDAGKQAGTWTVDASDIPTDGSYKYNMDSTNESLMLSFAISKKGIMTLRPYPDANEIYYLKRQD